MRFHIFKNHTLDGPYEVEELMQLEQFSPETMVCMEGELDWRPASTFPTLFPPSSIQEEVKVVIVPEPPRPKNWREAIISGDVPEVRYHAWQPPAVSKSSNATESPVSPSPISTRRPAGLLYKNRKGVLLGIVWSIFMGAYYPQMDSLQSIFDQLACPAEVLPFNRVRRHTRQARKAWKPIPPMRPVAAASKPMAPPVPEITVLAADDYGDGYITQTIVVTRMVDGVKLQETKKVQVPKRAHRTRRRHSSVRINSGS